MIATKSKNTKPLRGHRKEGEGGTGRGVYDFATKVDDGGEGFGKKRLPHIISYVL